MRKVKNVICSFLLCLSLLPCRSEEGLHFSIAGQSCTEEQYLVRKSDILHGGVLYFTLSGSFATLPIEMRLTVRDSYNGLLLQGAELSLNATSIAANQEAMLISRSAVDELRTGKQQLALTFLPTIPADATVTIIATQPNSTNELGRISIRIEGLRTPGSEVNPNEDGCYFNVLPTRIRVYATPMKQGSITVDLQNIPQGRSGTIELIDLLGITTHSMHVIGGTTVQIPASVVKQGLYFVRVSIEGTPIYTGRAVIGI